MDGVSAALILAVAGGAGGAVGDQAWRGLVALVHRPARGTTAPQSGDAQLDRLRQTPGDEESAAELAQVLTERASVDQSFQSALGTWRCSAEELYPTHRVGTIHNSVSGGTFHGPVIQTGGSVHFSEGTPPQATPLG